MRELFLTVTFLLGWILFAHSNDGKKRNDGFIRISVKDYESKVYSAWLGQIIGNIYGLPHENAYIENPGPDNFPLGYKDLGRVKDANGAFSDDDTDVEYMYLLLMEKYGIEPTYEQVVGAWKYHIRDRVWLANRAALGLMHFGFTPPVTGQIKYNPHWFQIDPQLVNEIWAVTAPGMNNYAVKKSKWAAQITNDSWGLEPTMCYGAMFSAAFFYADINVLIDIGLNSLPEESKFRQTIEDMKALYQKYPVNWKKARHELAQKYYENEPVETKTIWNANLNGACGILALLYGQGDFQKTLDMAVVMGYDADNQTASMCGLLAVANGIKSIPEDLLYPLKAWKEPFNDRYINVSRYDLPDASIKDMAKRTAAMGAKIILAHGGKKITEKGKEYLLINKNADFTIPLEFTKGPEPVIEVGKNVRYTFPLSGADAQVKWEVTKGEFPQGLVFENGNITGTAEFSGIYPIELTVKKDDKQLSREFKLRVRSKNLASEATSVIANVKETDTSIRDSLWLSVPSSLYNNSVEAIRDGKAYGANSTFYSINSSHDPKIDYYGYEWFEKKEISLISYHTGSIEEMGGWFTSLNVQYQNEAGLWTNVSDIKITPGLIPGNQPFNKPHFVEYMLSFDPVKTKAIRIIGDAGGAPHWYSRDIYFTSISELSVYKE